MTSGHRRGPSSAASSFEGVCDGDRKDHADVGAPRTRRQSGDQPEPAPFERFAVNGERPNPGHPETARLLDNPWKAERPFMEALRDGNGPSRGRPLCCTSANHESSAIMVPPRLHGRPRDLATSMPMQASRDCVPLCSRRGAGSRATTRDCVMHDLPKVGHSLPTSAPRYNEEIPHVRHKARRQRPRPTAR